MSSQGAEFRFVKAKYRCRRCQGINHISPISPEAMGESLSALVTNPERHHGPVSLFKMHVCPDGGYGILDLMGAEPHE